MKQKPNPKKNYKKEILNKIKEIINNNPNIPVSTHLVTAFSDYTSFEHFDGVSDKELFYLLEKYVCEIELDMIASPEELEKIVKDAEKLTRGFPYDEDEEEDEIF